MRCPACSVENKQGNYENRVQSLKRNLSNIDDNRLEFAAAMGLAVFGLWLLNPLSTFTIYASSYAFMATIMPEDAWGALFLAIGLFAIAGVWFNRFAIRRIGVLALFVAQVFLLVSIGSQSKWQSTGIEDHFAWVVISAWAYLRHIR